MGTPRRVRSYRRGAGAFAIALMVAVTAGATHATPSVAVTPSFVGDAFPPAPDLGLTTNHDAEPGLAVAPDGAFWATSNASDSRRAAGLSANDVWRSVDGGVTYQWVAAPFNAMPDRAGFGGGDGDIAVAPERNALGYFNVYVTGLWYVGDVSGVIAGDVSLAVSPDGGATWVVDELAAPLPADDRPWVAADGPCTVYLNYHAGPTVANVVNRYDLCDPAATAVGMTLTPVTSTRYPTLAASAATDAPDTYVTVGFNKPAVDTAVWSPFRHRVYIPMMDCPELTLEQEVARAEAAQADCPAGHVAEVTALVSADGGATWTLHHVADSTNGHVAIWPVAAAVDGAGAVFLAWSDERHVYLTVSHDGGDTWTPTNAGAAPVDVAPSGTSLFAAIAAGTAGVVELSWYGTSVAADPMDVAAMGAPGSGDGAQWYVHWARSTDAGATWTQTVVSSLIHRGIVCPKGTGCTVPGSRSLLDDFGLAISPVTSRASIAYTTDLPVRASAYATEQP